MILIIKRKKKAKGENPSLRKRNTVGEETKHSQLWKQKNDNDATQKPAKEN